MSPNAGLSAMRSAPALPSTARALYLPAKKVSKLPMPTIEAAGIGLEQPLHAIHEIRLWGFSDQVKMK